MKSFGVVLCVIALAAFGLLATTATIFANATEPGSISGVVTDAATGLPIGNAVVTLYLDSSARPLEDNQVEVADKSCPPIKRTGPTPDANETILATATTNPLGRYAFANVLGSEAGTGYALYAYRAGYLQVLPCQMRDTGIAGASLEPRTLEIHRSESHLAEDISLAPLVQLSFVPPQTPFGPVTYEFKNFSDRHVTVVAWGWACRNTDKCDPGNTQTSWAGWRNRKVLAIGSDETARFTLKQEALPRGPHTGYSAVVSYCYFTSFDLPWPPHVLDVASMDVPVAPDLKTLAGLSFDIVTWPTGSAAPEAPTNCRNILSPPPSTFP